MSQLVQENSERMRTKRKKKKKLYKAKHSSGETRDKGCEEVGRRDDTTRQARSRGTFSKLHVARSH